MAETANGLTMDRLITGLGDIRASIEGEGQDICQAAVNILFALKEEGAQTTADALDILHDYQLQSKQYAALQKKTPDRWQALLEGRRVALPGLQRTV